MQKINKNENLNKLNKILDDELTPEEQKTLDYVMVDKLEWILNAVYNQVRRLKDAIVDKKLEEESLEDIEGLPKVVNKAKTLPEKVKDEIILKKNIFKGNKKLEKEIEPVLKELLGEAGLKLLEKSSIRKLDDIIATIKIRIDNAVDEIIEDIFNSKKTTATIKEEDIPDNIPRRISKIKKEDKLKLIGKATIKTAKERNKEAEKEVKG